MKNILSYILIIFLFASSAGAMNFSEERLEVAEEIELCEKELEARKEKTLHLSQEQRSYSYSFLHLAVSIQIQVSNNDFVYSLEHKKQLYILFDTFLI